MVDEMDAHGVLEGGAHDDVDVVHGLGASPVPFMRPVVRRSLYSRSRCSVLYLSIIH